LIDFVQIARLTQSKIFFVDALSQRI